MAQWRAMKKYQKIFSPFIFVNTSVSSKRKDSLGQIDDLIRSEKFYFASKQSQEICFWKIRFT